MDSLDVSHVGAAVSQLSFKRRVMSMHIRGCIFFFS